MKRVFWHQTSLTTTCTLCRFSRREQGVCFVLFFSFLLHDIKDYDYNNLFHAIVNFEEEKKIEVDFEVYAKFDVKWGSEEVKEEIF